MMRRRRNPRNPQTETAAFKRWFGDSKVVDARGEPLVVYHGTSAVFDTFDVGLSWDGGFHFGTAEAATNRIADGAGLDPERWSAYFSVFPNIMPVYLSIKRPLRIDYDPIDEETWAFVIGEAKDNGYDGIVYPNSVESGESWVAFDPRQIKSATGNVGTFDPSDPSILRNPNTRTEPPMSRRNPDPTTTPASSAAFRRWFGDSKVVDTSGKPLVVYHGSQQGDIEAFQIPRHRRAPAFYFTEDDELASGYGEHIYSVYLRMERPLVVDARGADWSAIPQTAVQMRGWSAEDKKVAREMLKDWDDGRYTSTSTDAIGELARTFGFDGAIIRNVVDAAGDHDYEASTTVYIVFDPTQIKSARENAGTFDPDDPSIYRNPRRTVADRIQQFERYEVRMAASENLPLFGKGFLALAAQRYTEDEYVRLIAAALELNGRWGLLAEPSAYPAPKGVLLKALKERYAVERTKPLTVKVRFRDMWEATAYIGEGRYDQTEVGFVVATPGYPFACPEDYATLRRAHGDAPTYEVVSSRVHPLMQRKGLGARLYRALGETIGKERGAYLFANACGSSGDTSVEARRVYRSLGRDFPTQGLVVYFPPAKTNPRRNGRGGYTSADRTDPDLWEAVKREVTAGSKGGKPGQWSARKAQLAVALYQQRGGGYYGPKDPRNSLAKWTREKWRTKSGRPSLETGERYLPSRAIAALTDAEYAATTRAKRAGMRKGQQFVPQPEAVALKVRSYRKNPRNPQTETAAFKRWFGKSVTTDRNGEPEVFYHGSDEPDIEEFGVQRTSYGYFFTPDIDTAAYYGDNVYEVYLKIENLADLDEPLVFDEIAREAVDYTEERDREAVQKFAARLYHEGYGKHPAITAFFDAQPGFEYVLNEGWDVEEMLSDNDVEDRDVDALVARINQPNVTKAYNEAAPAYSQELREAEEAYGGQDFYMNYQNDFLRAAENLGYDGVVLTDPSPTGEAISYVVFSPKQIKSATKNAGTFDLDDANIYRNPRRKK